MNHAMTGDDVLSLSMFWAGALMAFTPLIAAGVVLWFWWRGRTKDAAGREPRTPPPPSPSAGA
jgi:hypothetical protein